MRQYKELPNIDLSFKEKTDGTIILNDCNLLDDVAKDWAKAIWRTKRTQARNFYDKILELETDIKNKDFESVYPFIKMLNSKVAYGRGRGVVSPEFQDMMSQCLNQIKLDKTKKCIEQKE